MPKYLYIYIYIYILYYIKLFSEETKMGLTWDMSFVTTVPGMAMAAEVVISTYLCIGSHLYLPICRGIYYSKYKIEGEGVSAREKK